MLITTTDVYQCHFNFAHGQPTCKALYEVVLCIAFMFTKVSDEDGFTATVRWSGYVDHQYCYEYQCKHPNNKNN